MNKKEIYKYIYLVLFIIPWTLFCLWLENYYLLLLNLFFIDLIFTKSINWHVFKGIKIPVWAKSSIEWFKAIIIALLITVMIRTLIAEAYKIPTPSMEKTLLVGDFLLVSKLSYGPRLPNTPLSFPFLPAMLPGGITTYSKLIQLPYKRLKGLSAVKRNDIIVFNFPEGDSVATEFKGQNYYSLVRQLGKTFIEDNSRLIYHPVDKRDNYIKRCIGIPGDRIRISGGEVFINNFIADSKSTQIKKYYVRTKKGRLNDSILIESGISPGEVNYQSSNNIHIIPLDSVSYHSIKSIGDVQSIQKYIEPSLSYKNIEVFPHDEFFQWSPDEFGPLTVPAKGMKIHVNKDNFPLYKRIITNYEKNITEIKGDDIYINGKLARSYIFKMDYYFVLGDNRPNSADSRFWGFVPEDHLVGKAVFLWFSKDPARSIIKGVRINRMFKQIN